MTAVSQRRVAILFALLVPVSGRGDEVRAPLKDGVRDSHPQLVLGAFPSTEAHAGLDYASEGLGNAWVTSIGGAYAWKRLVVGLDLTVLERQTIDDAIFVDEVTGLGNLSLYAVVPPSEPHDRKAISVSPLARLTLPTAPDRALRLGNRRTSLSTGLLVVEAGMVAAIERERWSVSMQHGLGVMRKAIDTGCSRETATAPAWLWSLRAGVSPIRALDVLVQIEGYGIQYQPPGDCETVLIVDPVRVWGSFGARVRIPPHLSLEGSFAIPFENSGESIASIRLSWNFSDEAQR
ncbi:MAG TPA: hypothetical protein VGD80_06050 [Kofleriaceae bacterium]